MKRSYKDIRCLGEDNGYELATWVDLPNIGDKTKRHIDYVGLGQIKDADDAEAYFVMLCDFAEENNRSYSPFEFLAKEFSDREDSEECWGHYSSGLYEGYKKCWEQRSKDYYTE